MAQQYKTVFCLCVILGGVAYTGYKFGPRVDDYFFMPTTLLAETRGTPHGGTADFLVDSGSFAGNTTYFFVRDSARSSGKPTCIGGPYSSDGSIKMQEAVWSKDGSVIAVRVKVGAPAGHGFRRYDGAFWIDAYDFHTHHAVADGSKLTARSQAIARLLKRRGGPGSKTLSSPSTVGKPLKAPERREYDRVEKDYRPLYNSDEGIPH